jgi:SulP family sulfate permease
MEGPLSFGSARDIARILVSSREKEVLVIDLSDVPFIDSSASISLEEAMHALQRENDVFLLCGLQPAVRATLDSMGMIESLPADRIFDSRLDALQAAKQYLADDNK